MIAEPEAATQIEERLRRLVQHDHRVIADHVTNAVRVAKLHGAQPIADASEPINVASCYELSGAAAATSFDDMQRR